MEFGKIEKELSLKGIQEGFRKEVIFKQRIKRYNG